MVTRGSPKPLFRVRVLVPLPNKTLHRLVKRFICLMRAPKDENGAVVNDVPVARQSRPDRRAQREETESLCPCQKNQFRKRLVLFLRHSPECLGSRLLKSTHIPCILICMVRTMQKITFRNRWEGIRLCLRIQIIASLKSATAY